MAKLVLVFASQLVDEEITLVDGATFARHRFPPVRLSKLVEAIEGKRTHSLPDLKMKPTYQDLPSMQGSATPKSSLILGPQRRSTSSIAR